MFIAMHLIHHMHVTRGHAKICILNALNVAAARGPYAWWYDVYILDIIIYIINLIKEVHETSCE